MERSSILVLEDSPLDAELVRLQVEKAGLPVDIHHVATRDEFERALLESNPQLILSDYSLPDFDGMVALDLAQLHTPDVPFIFVSGTLGEDIAIDALQRGATDYVLKQRLDRLAPAVKRALHENDLRRRQRTNEEALRTSQLRFRELADATPQLLWATDIRGRVVYTNHWARQYGGEIEKSVELPGLNICHPDDALRLRTSWLQCLRGMHPGDLEFRLRRNSDHAYRWHLCRFVPLHNSRNEVEGWVAIAVDVEEQKLREQALRASEQALRAAKELLEERVQERTQAYANLSARLMTIQDEERRRLARDLHDGFGQSLVALKMNLDGLRMSQPMAARTYKNRLEESSRLLDDCLSDVRTMAYLLHPPLLDECGFGSAAKWYIDGFAERSGIQIDLRIGKDFGRLPSEIEVVLFRILQESLSNIHRHAQTDKAEVSVVVRADWLEMRIRDFGVGISEEQLQVFQNSALDGRYVGVGIAGMRERIRDVGGTLAFARRDGTTVIAKMPLAKKIKDADSNYLSDEAGQPTSSGDGNQRSVESSI